MCAAARLSLGIAVAGLLFAPRSFGLAERKEDPAAAQGMYNRLPYAGYGVVSVLNDGTLLIELGPRPGSVSPNEGGDGTFSPEDVLMFGVPASGLSLVQSGGEVFLDRNGRQVRERRVPESVISRIELDGSVPVDPNAPLSEVARFEGDVSLEYDRDSKILTVAAQDTESTGNLFRLSAPVTAAAEQGKDDGGLVLVQADPDPVAASNCSISCQLGSASISCAGGCVCRCVANKPQCNCLSGM